MSAVIKGTAAPNPEEHRGTSHYKEELHATEKKNHAVLAAQRRLQSFEIRTYPFEELHIVS